MKAVFETMFPMIDKAIMELYFDDGLTAFETSFSNALNDDIDIDPFLNDLIQMKTDKAKPIDYRSNQVGNGHRNLFISTSSNRQCTKSAVFGNAASLASPKSITSPPRFNISLVKFIRICLQNAALVDFLLTAVCAGAELHEIGMRMVADMFELSGWDTYFLGSNLPPEMILAQLKSAPTTVLAVSATTPSHLLEVEELIKIIRFDTQLASIKIIVGGRAFNETPDVWKLVGADGFAADARSAIGLANRLVGAIE
ncbi:MAG: cobalamin B12-binding domain-containing protein [Bacillus subtilis]|nr:cobalamin B12-binding domain-containing protein [Bacillus subtilis]